MKVVALREAKQRLSGWTLAAQKDAVLITKHGRPWAFLMGAGIYDWEDVMYMKDPEFWAMIEQARKQPSRPMSEVRKAFGLPVKASRRPAKRPRR